MDFPGPLDVLLRDLHALWCNGDEHNYHLSDPDPVRAALLLDTAFHELAATPSGRELLERVAAVVWAVGAHGYFSSRGSDDDDDDDEEAVDLDALDLD